MCTGSELHWCRAGARCTDSRQSGDRSEKTAEAMLIPLRYRPGQTSSRTLTMLLSFGSHNTILGVYSARSL